MALNNIPRQDLSDLLARYKKLPFPNGTPWQIKVSVNTTFAATMSVSNADNDDVISVSEGIDVPYDSITNTIKADNSYKRAEALLKSEMEELIQQVNVLSRAFSVPKAEIWQYLGSH